MASAAFKKALIERALGGKLTHHLGYPPGAADSGSSRYGVPILSGTVIRRLVGVG